MKRPNFFIVGAPKSGTTAMNDYLAKHPGIFMAKKELHFFGMDLPVRTRPSETEYLAYFDGASTETVRGEASVWYLYSQLAAAEIKAFDPEARILIMLRNPVDLLYAMHSQHLLDGNEDVADFRQALNLDDSRRAGKHLPHSLDFLQLPPYHDIGLYAKQVERFLHHFGKEQLHIILYEDFARDPAKELRSTLAFLGLNSEGTMEFPVINPNKRIRFPRLHRFLKNPSARSRSFVRIVLPAKRIRHSLMRWLFGVNTRVAKRPPMDEATRSELQSFFAADVRELEGLIKRDLSAWWSGGL